MTDFHENTDKALDPARVARLARRINELSLKIQGTELELHVEQLYSELQAHGISFRPKCYLSDEWGCPHGVPIIGIPFYLADPELSRLEGELTGVEAETPAEVMMYLRHEAGHAWNYAYRFYAQPEWRQLFGPFSRPYRDHYRASPFSARFVRHIPGWYAQKHPDEDFAETFAVWLTPGLDWRRIYADTPALEKLRYIDRLAHEFGSQPAVVMDDTLDAPVESLNTTLAEWYGLGQDANRDGVELPAILNDDLRTLFSAAAGQPAAELLRTERQALVREVNYWTGVSRWVIGSLIDELRERAQCLELKVDAERLGPTRLAVATFVTTLVMNYRYTNTFVKN